MTTPLLQVGRLRAMLRQLSRVIPRASPGAGLRPPVCPDSIRQQRPGAHRLRRTRSRQTAAAGPRRRDRPLGLGSGGRPAGPPLQVITIDNRGIGASANPPGHFSTRSMAQRPGRPGPCRHPAGQRAGDQPRRHGRPGAGPQRTECSSGRGPRFLAISGKWRSEREQEMRCAWWS
jgi:hypothetical protein